MWRNRDLQRQARSSNRVNNRLFVGILQRDVVLLRKMQKAYSYLDKKPFKIL
jgi:hypothetical protein